MEIGAIKKELAETKEAQNAAFQEFLNELPQWKRDLILAQKAEDEEESRLIEEEKVRIQQEEGEEKDRLTRQMNEVRIREEKAAIRAKKEARRRAEEAATKEAEELKRVQSSFLKRRASVEMDL